MDVIRYNVGISFSQKVLLEEVIDDYMTSSHAAKEYFDMLGADQKEFIAFDQSAHYPHFEEKEKFFEWVSKTFL